MIIFTCESAVYADNYATYFGNAGGEPSDPTQKYDNYNNAHSPTVRGDFGVFLKNNNDFETIVRDSQGALSINQYEFTASALRLRHGLYFENILILSYTVDSIYSIVTFNTNSGVDNIQQNNLIAKTQFVDSGDFDILRVGETCFLYSSLGSLENNQVEMWKTDSCAGGEHYFLIQYQIDIGINCATEMRISNNYVVALCGQSQIFSIFLRNRGMCKIMEEKIPNSGLISKPFIYESSQRDFIIF